MVNNWLAIKDYNKCLSRVRAEKIESILKSSGSKPAEIDSNSGENSETMIDFVGIKDSILDEANPHTQFGDASEYSFTFATKVDKT